MGWFPSASTREQYSGWTTQRCEQNPLCPWRGVARKKVIRSSGKAQVTTQSHQSYHSGPESLCRVCEMWQRSYFSMRKYWIVGEEPEEWRRQIFFQFQNWKNGCIPETTGQSVQHWSLTTRKTWLLTGWWAQ